jgi:gliding motility-associated-like protein
MRLIFTFILALLSFNLLSQVSFNNCDSTNRVQIFYVDMNEGSTYNWSISGGVILETNQNRVTVLFPDTIGKFVISLIEFNENGCPGNVKKLIVELEPCENEVIWFPTVFTPNGDGLNDVFNILGEFSGDEFELEIYDRWGVSLFISNDKLKGWDGTYRGRLVQDGVYVYRLFTKLNSKYFIKYGTVTLIK